MSPAHPDPGPLDREHLVAELVRAYQSLEREREDSRRAVARYRALYEVSIALAETRDLEEVLHAVLDHALADLSARDGSIMLLDDRREHLTIVAARGLPAEVVKTTRVRLGEGISGYVAKTGRPKLLPHGFKDRYSRVEAPAGETASAICVPLKTRGSILGVLNVRDRVSGGDFTTRDLDLLAMLATLAAAAISNQRMQEDCQRRGREFEVLYQAGLAITSSRNRDQTLQRLLDEATGLLNARRGSIMLVDAARIALDIVAAHGLPDDVVNTMKPKLGEGIAGYVAATGQMKVLKAGFRDRYSQVEPGGEPPPAAICVPLQHEGLVLGVLNVSDRDGAGDFDDDDLRIALALAPQAAVAIHKAQMYERLREQFNGTVTALSVLLDSRDPYTEKHSVRVAEYARVIARRMGFTTKEVERIWVAGLLHDIGKIGVPEAVLKKQGRLEASEFGEMKKHPVIGYETMKNVPHAEDLLPAIRHHHEWFASGGYPDNLEGDRIPLWARIICVADTFDAMTSDRPYRKGLPVDAVLRELREKSGIQFDPQIVQVFNDAVQAGEVDLYLNGNGRRGPSQPPTPPAAG